MPDVSAWVRECGISRLHSSERTDVPISTVPQSWPTVNQRTYRNTVTLVCLAYLDLSPPIHRGYVRLHDLRLRLTCIVIHIIYFRKCVDSGRLDCRPQRRQRWTSILSSHSCQPSRFDVLLLFLTFDRSRLGRCLHYLHVRLPRSRVFLFQADFGTLPDLDGPIKILPYSTFQVCLVIASHGTARRSCYSVADWCSVLVFQKSRRPYACAVLIASELFRCPVIRYQLYAVTHAGIACACFFNYGMSTDLIYPTQGTSSPKPMSGMSYQEVPDFLAKS